MGITKGEMVQLSELVAQSVVKALIDNGLVGANNNTKNSKKGAEKSAYQKTEQLLYNYNGFKKIVAEKQLEIEELRQYGVPGKSLSIVAYSPNGSSAPGTVLQEEAVECAVRNVECAIQSTVQVIAMIDKGMKALENDPYYKVLEMRYFDDYTLESIGVHFNCDHSTISRNKSRLVKELALRFFPDEVVSEYMN